MGNRADSSMEKIIGDLKLKQADQELAALIAAEAEQTDPEAKQHYLAAIEQKKSEIEHVRLEQAEARVHAFPNDGEFRFNLGEALFKVGQYKRAADRAAAVAQAAQRALPGAEPDGLRLHATGHARSRHQTVSGRAKRAARHG